MVDVRISDLLDGTNIITSDAVAPFDQDGITFNTSILVNAPNVLYVENESQLEDKLGVNLEIPDTEARTIVYLKSFTQTKPFLLGAGSTLELKTASNRVTITFTGSHIVKLTTPGISGAVFSIVGIFRAIGNGTNKVIDLVLSEGANIGTLILSNFQDFGTIEALAVNLSFIALIGFTTGIIIKNAIEVGVGPITVLQTGATGITILSIIGTTPSITTIEELNGILFAGDSLLFLDPNSTGRSKITNSTINLGDFYQQGTDIAIDSVADNGSGEARFTTAASHGLVVGRPVVLSGFGVATTYNGTFIVTAVDVPTTGTTFDVEEIVFDVTDTGNMNTASVDSTSTLSLSFDNAPANDSMTTAQVGFTNIATPIVVTITTQDVPVLIGGTQFTSENLERATVTTAGQITNLTKKTKKFPVTFSALIEKAGGGVTDIGLLIIINGALVLTNTFNIPHSVNAGVIQISATRDFELAENDTIELAVVNFDGTSNINVSQANIVYSIEA